MTPITVEERLFQIWSNLLSVEGIKLHSHFFELGGDPLLFKLLKRRIQASFKLPEACQFNIHAHSRYAEQLNALNNQLTTHTQPLIELKSGENDIPIIILHPIGGTLFTYMPLLSKLQTNQSIFGIQDSVLSGDFRYYNSFSEQASYYVDILTRELNSRSFILLGHSFGGSLAFEMARCLIQKSYEIKHLIIFDTWVDIPFDASFYEKFVEAIHRQTDKIKPDLFFNTQRQLDFWMDIIWNRMLSLIDYTPKPISVDATLFLAEDVLKDYQQSVGEDYGWSNYLNSLDIHKIPGNHETILRADHINKTMETINQTIKKALT